jgi:hypothetical protein
MEQAEATRETVKEEKIRLYRTLETKHLKVTDNKKNKKIPDCSTTGKPTRSFATEHVSLDSV